MSPRASPEHAGPPWSAWGGDVPAPSPPCPIPSCDLPTSSLLCPHHPLVPSPLCPPSPPLPPSPYPCSSQGYSPQEGEEGRGWEGRGHSRAGPRVHLGARGWRGHGAGGGEGGSLREAQRALWSQHPRAAGQLWGGKQAGAGRHPRPPDPGADHGRAVVEPQAQGLRRDLGQCRRPRGGLGAATSDRLPAPHSKFQARFRAGAPGGGARGASRARLGRAARDGGACSPVAVGTSRRCCRLAGLTAFSCLFPSWFLSSSGLFAQITTLFNDVHDLLTSDL